jgi:hypothetical protein
MAKGTGKLDKEAKAAAKAARKAQSKERRRQLWQAFQLQRREDKWLVPILVGAVLGTTLVMAGFAWLIGAALWLFIPMGLLLGVLLAFILFGRRVTKTVYAKAEGQTGAAAWALDNLRGSWRVTNAVAGTTHLDAVHRVIGRPGVVLVGEGAPHRVKTLIAQEKKRTARLVGDTPIYDVQVGNGEGQVPLSKLQRHLSKLPKNITAKQMDSLETRLAAISSRSGGGAAMPKAPVPGGAKMRSVQRTIRRR